MSHLKKTSPVAKKKDEKKKSNEDPKKKSNEDAKKKERKTSKLAPKKQKEKKKKPTKKKKKKDSDSSSSESDSDPRSALVDVGIDSPFLAQNQQKRVRLNLKANFGMEIIFWNGLIRKRVVRIVYVQNSSKNGTVACEI